MKLNPVKEDGSDSIKLFDYGNDADTDAVDAAFKNNTLKVWTMLDCEGKTIILQGLHFVNRMAYIVTEKPAPYAECEVESRTLTYTGIIQAELGEVGYVIIQCDDPEEVNDRAIEVYCDQNDIEAHQMESVSLLGVFVGEVENLHWGE